jgi:hypothetical protein
MKWGAAPFPELGAAFSHPVLTQMSAVQILVDSGFSEC